MQYLDGLLEIHHKHQPVGVPFKPFPQFEDASPELRKRLGIEGRFALLQLPQAMAQRSFHRVRESRYVIFAAADPHQGLG